MEFLQQLAGLDLESRAVLVFAVALGGLLFGIAGRWRQILREAPALPGDPKRGAALHAVR